MINLVFERLGWTYSGGKFIYTGRFSRKYSGNDLWNWTTTQIEDQYDRYAADLPYPALEENYAVVIATSTGPNNYRHQADANLDADTFRNILEGAQGNYRKMLAVMETCYSGSVAQYCEGLPGVLFLCAARSGETSHAGLFNDACYGNVYRSTMEEFVIPVGKY